MPSSDDWAEEDPAGSDGLGDNNGYMEIRSEQCISSQSTLYRRRSMQFPSEVG